MKKKKTSPKPRKVAPKKSAARKASATKEVSPKEKHRQLVSAIDDLLKSHGIKERFMGLSLLPRRPPCNPPCGENEHCARRINRNTHEVIWVCEPN